VSDALGLIAGRGWLPLAVARAARRQGRKVTAIAFPRHTDPALGDEAEVLWLAPGEVGTALAAFRSAGVRDVVMAGKVPKQDLYAAPEVLRADADARRLLDALPDHRDDSILAAVAALLEARGLRLLGQAELVPELLAGEGPLGRLEPDAAQWRDVAFGLPLARAVAGLDIGQTVVVKDGAVLAVEAIEGTDAAIRRAGALRKGACVVKVAKPRQDPRFDVPAIGRDTLTAMREAEATVLACQAGATLVLEREALVSEADRAGIALVGVAVGDAAGGEA
jgi:DUF1009 family protein